MKYRGIVLLKEEGHSVKKCCEVLSVSFSSFHKWYRRGPSKRQERDGQLKTKILGIFGKSKETYGSPRMQKSLKRQGEKIGRAKVAKLIQEEGLSARKEKSFRPKTTENNPNDRKSPREYKIESHTVSKINEVWASDLTYISTEWGFVYLVVVMDIYNRHIVGRDLSDNMEAANTKTALINALRKIPGKLDNLIFHSDQGVQYCSGVVREKLSILNIKQSMSRKGNCYDNAFVESFFHTLKNELSKKKFKDLEDVRREVSLYIQHWYNTERLHSSLGYMSPLEYAETK